MLKSVLNQHQVVGGGTAGKKGVKECPVALVLFSIFQVGISEVSPPLFGFSGIGIITGKPLILWSQVLRSPESVWQEITIDPSCSLLKSPKPGILASQL